MRQPIRILLLADSHLGFDLPERPRSGRRRRGEDFLANYASALAPALAGEVDLVVHGGDVFDRPRVSPALAWQGLEPLARIADTGIAVFVVPGNHERSRLPHRRFATHPLVHLFDRPRTFELEVRGERLAVAGFPFERRDIRTRFPEVLERTGWRKTRAAVRLLCMHQCVEGATVGPVGFTFRGAADVVRCADLPGELSAVVSGHIHRHQVLTRDLYGCPLATPVLYPGSIERTSFAEIDEAKGYMLLTVADGAVRSSFMRLYARPMVAHELDVTGMRPAEVSASVGGMVESAPEDAVLRISVKGVPVEGVWRELSAPRIRSVAPAGMTVEIRAGDNSAFGRRRDRHGSRRMRRAGTPVPAASPQLDLGVFGA